MYSDPCNLRPLHLTVPSIFRPAISDTIPIFSVQISFHFKTTSNLMPYFSGWRGHLKIQGPLYMLQEVTQLVQPWMTMLINTLASIMSIASLNEGKSLVYKPL